MGPGQTEARVPVLRDRGAVRRQFDGTRSSSSIWCGRFARCRTSCAGGRRNAARCNAGAAKPSRYSIPTRVGQRCEFCGSPELVDYQEIKSPIRPQSLLPFKVAAVNGPGSDPTMVREQVARSRTLKARALVDTVHGVYIPYWTFDAQVVCPWEGEAGHYYYTTETYRDNQGRTQTRQVQHVRWEPASGVVEHFFDDEPVPGTQGCRSQLAAADRAVHDQRARRRTTRRFSRASWSSTTRSCCSMRRRRPRTRCAEARELCAAQIRGDTYRQPA